MLTRHIAIVGAAGLGLVLCSAATVIRIDAQATVGAQTQAPVRGGGRGAALDPTKPHKLAIAAGTRARYRVTEQLAGISFPSDAVGTTEAVAGAFIMNPDGSFAAGSKITVDLKTLTSDQSLRDNYIQTRTLQTGQFPTLDLVPKKAVGLAAPLPASGQAGFQLVTDMTLHGVTKETTWNVVATFGSGNVSGRATTTVDFAMFNMTKPSLARLLSVDDKIHLEIEFRCTRSVQ